MVVVLNANHIYRYPVEFVMHVQLTKYPSPKEKNVVAVDVVEKSVDPNGIEYVQRIATCLNVVPGFLRKFSALNISEILVQEECWINPNNRTLIQKTCNLTWSKHVKMTEESHFSPVRDNPHWTSFQQRGTIDVYGFGCFGRIIERFARAFFQNGIQKSIKLMEELLSEKSKTMKAPRSIA